jgi:hypothetical protein
MRILTVILILTSLGLSAQEQILLKQPIPNRILRQGEATLLQTRNRTRIRIELHTRHLTRIEAKIISSEQQNWPDSADSLRFQTALIEAFTAARTESEKKVSFLIQWTCTADQTGDVKLVWSGGERILEDLSPNYIRDNMQFILMDQFDLNRVQAEKFLSHLK